VFTLTYCSKGAFNWTDVMNMDSGERTWFLRRLNSQLEREAKAERAASERARRRRK